MLPSHRGLQQRALGGQGGVPPLHHGAHRDMGDRAEGLRPSYPPRLLRPGLRCSAEHVPRDQRQSLVILLRTHCVTSGQGHGPKTLSPQVQKRGSTPDFQAQNVCLPGGQEPGTPGITSGKLCLLSGLDLSTKPMGLTAWAGVEKQHVLGGPSPEIWAQRCSLRMATMPL